VSALSYYKYIETLPSASHDADEPLSAFRTWNMRNNLQHLIDSSHQYRVNWCAAQGASLDKINYVGAAQRYQMRWTFPAIVTRADRPPSYDVRVGVMLSNTTSATHAIVTARIRPMGDGSIVGASDAFWQTVVSTTTAAAHWAVDAQVTWSAARSWVGAVRNYTLDEGTIFRVVSVAKLAFELDVIAAGPTNCIAAVVSAQLREYP
jgi:hypothetical protein